MPGSRNIAQPASILAFERSTGEPDREDPGTTMKHAAKKAFPVGQVRRFLEPGPIVLVSSRWRDQTNIMTMGWHTVMEFTPSLVGCVISSGNHSFRMIRDKIGRAHV